MLASLQKIPRKRVVAPAGRGGGADTMRRRRTTTRRTCDGDGDVLNLTMVGPPGSGKGTYSALLRQYRRPTPYLVLSAGDVLREHVAAGTAIGTRVAEDQRAGRLVADDALVAGALMASLLSSSSDGEAFILDGFPRTVAQANLIHEEWPEHLRVRYAVDVRVPETVCTLKILGRRTCRVCGEAFNIHGVDQEGFHLPANYCSCGSSSDNWDRRQDDTPEIAKARYEQFVVDTAPVLRYYEDRNRLIPFTPYNGIDDMPLLQALVDEKYMNR